MHTTIQVPHFFFQFIFRRQVIFWVDFSPETSAETFWYFPFTIWNKATQIKVKPVVCCLVKRGSQEKNVNAPFSRIRCLREFQWNGTVTTFFSMSLPGRSYEQQIKQHTLDNYIIHSAHTKSPSLTGLLTVPTYQLCICQKWLLATVFLWWWFALIFCGWHLPCLNIWNNWGGRGLTVSDHFSISACTVSVWCFQCGILNCHFTPNIAILLSSDWWRKIPGWSGSRFCSSIQRGWWVSIRGRLRSNVTLSTCQDSIVLSHSRQVAWGFARYFLCYRSRTGDLTGMFWMHNKTVHASFCNIVIKTTLVSVVCLQVAYFTACACIGRVYRYSRLQSTPSALVVEGAGSLAKVLEKLRFKLARVEVIDFWKSSHCWKQQLNVVHIWRSKLEHSRKVAEQTKAVYPFWYCRTALMFLPKCNIKAHVRIYTDREMPTDPFSL